MEKGVKPMDQDDIKCFVETDALILAVGNAIFWARRPNKERKAILKARAFMWRLGSLSNVSGKQIKQLFHLEDMVLLEDSIHNHGKDEPSLKVNIGNVIIFSCKMPIPHHLRMRK